MGLRGRVRLPAGYRSGGRLGALALDRLALVTLRGLALRRRLRLLRLGRLRLRLLGLRLVGLLRLALLGPPLLRLGLGHLGLVRLGLVHRSRLVDAPRLVAAVLRHVLGLLDVPALLAGRWDSLLGHGAGLLVVPHGLLAAQLRDVTRVLAVPQRVLGRLLRAAAADPNHPAAAAPTWAARRDAPARRAADSDPVGGACSSLSLAALTRRFGEALCR